MLATVLVVPVFKAAKQSPVLGYLFTGLVLGQLGWVGAGWVRGGLGMRLGGSGCWTASSPAWCWGIWGGWAGGWGDAAGWWGVLGRLFTGLVLG